MKAKLALTVALPLGLAALAAGHAVGCGGEGSPSVDAGPEAEASVQRDASRPRDAEPEPDAALHEIDGKWQLYPDFLPSCPLYLPKTSADMPAPLRWEPCPDNPNTPGRVCSKIVTDWEGGVRDTMNGFRRTNGAVVLMSTRTIDGDVVHLISEPDGPVELAVRVHSDTCGIREEPGDGEHYVYHAAGTLGKDGYDAALTGKLGERPRIINNHVATDPTDYSAGALGLVANDSFSGAKLFRWNEPISISIPLPGDTPNLQNVFYRFHTGPLFWPSSAGNEVYRTVYYTPATGSRVLLTNGNSLTTGAADLSTDGTDMVWLEGNGRLDGALGFTSFNVATAPYTLDPAQLQPKRIATDLAGGGFNEPFTVACGRAARLSNRVINGQDRTRILVVRLADGAQWWLDAENMFPLRPLGMTCDEIFVHAVLPTVPPAPAGVRTIARIRFDSLGPPHTIQPPL